ncbi:hypothetical protein JI435_201040, partial [Parastagonospora nodorum SN15]
LRRESGRCLMSLGARLVVVIAWRCDCELGCLGHDTILYYCRSLEAAILYQYPHFLLLGSDWTPWAYYGYRWHTALVLQALQPTSGISSGSRNSRSSHLFVI